MSVQNLRIYHFTPWFPYPEDPQLGVFIGKHIRALLPHSHSRLVTFYRPSAQKSGLVPHRINGLPDSVQWEVHSPPWKFALRIFRDFFSWRKRVDVLHLHVLDRYGCVLATTAHFLGIPVVISEHWTGYRKGLFNQLPKWDQKWRLKCMNWAKAITVVSPSLKVDIANLGIRTTVHIIPNILEPAHKLKRAYESPIKWAVIADLVDKQKNISGVIEAFQETHAKGEQLHIIGDGSDRTLLESVAKSREIFFHGRWENERVLQELNTFDVLIVNSNVETFSVVTAEALSAGLACIVTRSGGPEYLINSSNGLIVEPNNKSDLLRAMKFMQEHLHAKFKPAIIAQDMRMQFGSTHVTSLFVSVYHGC